MTAKKSKSPDRAEILEFWAAVMRGEEQDRSINRHGDVTKCAPSIHARLKASELLHAELSRARSSEPVAGGEAARVKLYEVK